MHNFTPKIHLTVLILYFGFLLIPKENWNNEISIYTEAAFVNTLCLIFDYFAKTQPGQMPLSWETSQKINKVLFIIIIYSNILYNNI